MGAVQVFTSDVSLQDLIDRPGLISAPGAFDALSARLIEAAGFPAIYMTGSGVAAAQFAYPDLGLLMLSELVDQARRIISAVSVPIIVDADTGYGGPLNVQRTVKEYERIGAAAVQIEDQEWPKKCGHFKGKRIISTKAMVEKIHAAVDSRKRSDLSIIARTDAVSVEGFQAAITRGQEYANAGADIIFLDALESMDQMEGVPKNIPKPVLINIDLLGKTPWLTMGDIEKLGYKIAIYPAIPQFSAIAAAKETLTQLLNQGTIPEMEKKRLSEYDFHKLTNLEEMSGWEEKYEF
jgi:2,3-dimethylmalate lyase